MRPDSFEVAGVRLVVAADRRVLEDLDRRLRSFLPPHWPFVLGGELSSKVQMDSESRTRMSLDGRTATVELADPMGIEIEAGATPVFADAVIRLAVSWALVEAGGLLVHACAVARGACAVVFFGASGAGKTTLAAGLGPALADELVALRPGGAGFEVVGTPWWRGRRDRLRLGALVHLVRGREPGVRPLGGGELVRVLSAEAARYLPDGQHQQRAFETITVLADGGGFELAAAEGRVVEDGRDFLHSYLGAAGAGA